MKTQILLMLMILNVSVSSVAQSGDTSKAAALRTEFSRAVVPTTAQLKLNADWKCENFDTFGDTSAYEGWLHFQRIKGKIQTVSKTLSASTPKDFALTQQGWYSVVHNAANQYSAFVLRVETDGNLVGEWSVPYLHENQVSTYLAQGVPRSLSIRSALSNTYTKCAVVRFARRPQSHRHHPSYGGTTDEGTPSQPPTSYFPCGNDYCPAGGGPVAHPGDPKPGGGVFPGIQIPGSMPGILN